MIVVILIKKIVSLFIVMLAGIFLVKCGILKSKDSKSLSELSIYLIMPCVILTSFQVEFTEHIRDGLLLAFAASVLIHIFLLAITHVLNKIFHFDAVEQVSIIYSNAGNLIVPLVSAMLGKEWVIYSSAFMAVQLLLIWTHGKAVLCEEGKWDIKKILMNINLISVFCGLVLFFTGIRFWEPLQDAMNSVSEMVGPVAMLVMGMVIGGINFEKFKSYRRLMLIVLFRLVVYPFFCMLIVLALGRMSGMKDASFILLITLLAAITPTANSVTQMAQVYGKDADYAGAINVVSIILCIITMPFYVMLYQKLV